MNLFCTRSLLFQVMIFSVGIVPVSGKNTFRQTDSTKFKSEKISRTESIVLNGNVSRVFPLFGAFKEKKWAEGWNPTPIYVSADTIEEGTTFKTKSHGFGEPEYIWRINKYEPQKNLIQYLVFSPNRYWTITVKCTSISDHKTSAEITYTFIGLNVLGNHLDEHFLDKMYEHRLKDWEQAINVFLSKDVAIKDN